MTSAAEHVRSPRQRELLKAAARLFAQRGYHAVGINDISGELGLTGPAFYRHYKSKEVVLIAILDDAISSHLDEVRSLVAAHATPAATLRAIIDNHVAFIFDQGANITTWRTEYRNLPDYDRHRLRYMQRLYTEEWVRAVGLLRPDLADERVRAMCQAAIAMIQFPTEFTIDLPRAELAPMLSIMAYSLLTDPASSDPVDASRLDPPSDRVGGARRRTSTIPARRKAERG